ncbi:Protein SRC2 [Bienertia sinuspersici]
MASRYEVEVTLSSAKDLKNVNWRHGPNKPYVVMWVDPDRKIPSRVDDEGDTSPHWDQTLVVPLDRPIEDATLHIDIVHAYPEEGTKPLIGSATLPLREVVDEVGMGGRLTRKLKLKRPSGRPQGKLEVEVMVRQPRYHAPDPYSAPPYGVSRDVPYGGAPYGAPPSGYPYGAPPSGYPYRAPPPPGDDPYRVPPARDPYAPTAAGYPYGAPPAHVPYAQPPYAQPEYAQPGYGHGQPGGYEYGQPGPVEEKKKSKFGGMGTGTGLAVGAVAGALGGLALAEGFDKFEDHIADEAAERVEDDLASRDFDDDDDGDFGGDDW